MLSLIHIYFTALTFANRILLDLMSAESDLQSAMWRGGEDRLADLFDQCLASVGKPVNAPVSYTHLAPHSPLLSPWYGCDKHQDLRRAA